MSAAMLFDRLIHQPWHGIEVPAIRAALAQGSVSFTQRGVKFRQVAQECFTGIPIHVDDGQDYSQVGSGFGHAIAF